MLHGLPSLSDVGCHQSHTPSSLVLCSLDNQAIASVPFCRSTNLAMMYVSFCIDQCSNHGVVVIHSECIAYLSQSAQYTQCHGNMYTTACVQLF